MPPKHRIRQTPHPTPTSEGVNWGGGGGQELDGEWNVCVLWELSACVSFPGPQALDAGRLVPCWSSPLVIPVRGNNHRIQPANPCEKSQVPADSTQPQLPSFCGYFALSSFRERGWGRGTHAHTHARTRTHAHTHTHTYARTHSQTHTHTYAHTHTHTHTHTHIHTHTHTQPTNSNLKSSNSEHFLRRTLSVKFTTDSSKTWMSKPEIKPQNLSTDEKRQNPDLLKLAWRRHKPTP